MKPCIVCGKELKSVMGEGNQPSGGLAFVTSGHYGSVAYDPMDGSQWLEINVCDECIRAASQKHQVLLGKVIHRPVIDPEYTDWVF